MKNNIIKANGQNLWFESFGNLFDPAILLIQGSGAQGILWPNNFCKLLAQHGYFVIRYDHRDTGMSSFVDFGAHPYNLMDLAKDAKGILESLNIRKAHIIGSSMGGYIAQLIGYYYPEMVLTLTFMMTSTISASLEHAFLEESENPFPLPLPTEEFADAILEGPILDTQSEVSIANYLLFIWESYNGKGKSFDKQAWYQLATLWYNRSKAGLQNINHRLAVNLSPLTRDKEVKGIQAPVLIIHGAKDPFFTLQHAYALQKVLPNASLKIIENMGHLFHEAFIEEVLQHIVYHLQNR